MGVGGKPQAMSLYDHVVADWAITQNAAIKAALAVDPRSVGGQAGRTPAEAEVSRLAVDLIRKMHELPGLVERLGAAQVFGHRTLPLTPEERALARL